MTDKIAVTGASGKLGQHILELLAEKTSADNIVAVVRDPSKVDAKYNPVKAPYDDTDALKSAFTGIDKVILISGNDIANREQQHRNVVDAAKASGVKWIGYTSIPYAEKTPLHLAQVHRLTEEYITNSGLEYTFYRNGWYIENYTENLDGAKKAGAQIGAVNGDQVINVAARRDYAQAAVNSLFQSSPPANIYTLFGLPLTLNELTKKVGIKYRQLPPADLTKIYSSFGMPAELAEHLADADVNANDDWLKGDDKDLRSLIGQITDWRSVI